MIPLVDANPITEYYLIRYCPNDEYEGCGFPQPPDNADIEDFELLLELPFELLRRELQ